MKNKIDRLKELYPPDIDDSWYAGYSHAAIDYWTSLLKYPVFFNEQLLVLMLDDLGINPDSSVGKILYEGLHVEQ